MRQALGEKKVRKLAKETGLNLVGALVRGGTDHRIDLLVDNGDVFCRFKDGSIKPSEIKHK